MYNETKTLILFVVLGIPSGHEESNISSEEDFSPGLNVNTIQYQENDFLNLDAVSDNMADPCKPTVSNCCFFNEITDTQNFVSM